SALTPPVSCTPAQVVKDHYRDDELSTEEADELAFDLLDELVDDWLNLWEAYDDCGLKACRESQTPYLFDKPLRSEELVGGPRCGSQFAMHIVAPRLYDFGGTLGRQYSVGDPLNLVEPTEWEGLAFWARVAPGSRNQLKVSIPERHSDERYEVD